MIAVRRRFAAIALAAALLVGASGCSLIGDVMQRKTTLTENLDLQRTTAIGFKSKWPNAETITFIEDGSFNGAGQWSAGADVIIGGKNYELILGPWMTGGVDLPSPPTSFPDTPVTVTYSDGTSEVLQ